MRATIARLVGIKIAGWREYIPDGLSLVLFSAKFLLYSNEQIWLVFGVFLKDEYHVRLENLSRLFFWRGLAGLCFLFFSPALDKWPTYRSFFFFNLLLTLCVTTLALAHSWSTVFITLLLQAFAYNGIQSSSQKLLGQAFERTQQARLTGLLEMAWGVATFIAMPIVGAVSGAGGFRAAFALLLALYVPLLIGLLVLARQDRIRYLPMLTAPVFMPPVTLTPLHRGAILETKHTSSSSPSSPSSSSSSSSSSSFSSPSSSSSSSSSTSSSPSSSAGSSTSAPAAWWSCLIVPNTTLLVSFFLSSIVTTVWPNLLGLWLVDKYAFSAPQVGGVSSLTGVCCLISELAVSWKGDQIGLPKVAASALGFGVILGACLFLAAISLHAWPLILIASFAALSQEASWVSLAAMAPLVAPASCPGVYLSFFFAMETAAGIVGGSLLADLWKGGASTTATCFTALLFVPALLMSRVASQWPKATTHRAADNYHFLLPDLYNQIRDDAEASQDNSEIDMHLSADDLADFGEFGHGLQVQLIDDPEMETEALGKADFDTGGTDFTSQDQQEGPDSDAEQPKPSPGIELNDGI